MPAKIDRCVEKVLKKKIADYKDKNGKAPSEKRKEKLKSLAWEICTKALE